MPLAPFFSHLVRRAVGNDVRWADSCRVQMPRSPLYWLSHLNSDDYTYHRFRLLALISPYAVFSSEFNPSLDQGHQTYLFIKCQNDGIQLEERVCWITGMCSRWHGHCGTTQHHRRLGKLPSLVLVVHPLGSSTELGESPELAIIYVYSILRLVPTVGPVLNRTNDCSFS